MNKFLNVVKYELTNKENWKEVFKQFSIFFATILVCTIFNFIFAIVCKKIGVVYNLKSVITYLIYSGILTILCVIVREKVNTYFDKT